MERNFPRSAPPDGGKLQKVKAWLEEADAVLIGAGAGLSTAAGFTYSGERFERYFSDFEAKYGFHDMYSGGFYPYASLEEFWAYWSRYIYVNRYDQPAGKPYEDLLSLVKEKDCFVLTTNVDHRFQAAGFDKERLFYTQGDYGLFQCSQPCHNTVREKYEPRLWRNLLGIFLLIFLAIPRYYCVIFTKIRRENLLAKGAMQSKAARWASQTRRSPQRVLGGTGKGFNKV